MKHLLQSIAIIATPLFSLAAQDTSTVDEILSLGEKLLTQAKLQYEKKDWFEATELAERARTAFLALLELYASQNRAADLRKLNESVSTCNQLIRLARDARKAEQAKLAPPPDPKKPADPAVPPKDPADPIEAAPKPPVKPEPPGAEVQERALRSVRQVFQSEYAKVALADRQALAKKLVEEAKATKGDLAAQFILFREAADLSAQASDVATAFATIDSMGKEFTLDTLAFKVATLSKVPPATTHEFAGPAVEACLNVVAEALHLDHYELASFVIKKADAISRNPTNVTLQAKVQARSKAVGEIQRERETLKKAERILSEKPADAEACLQVGKFHCFMKGDWEKGIPILRQGSDGELRRLAETEAAKPSGAELRMDLGDAWSKLADRENNSIAKGNLIARVRFWYQQALPGLSGFPKTRVEKLLSGLEEEEKSRWAVNLFKLIEPAKDGVKGNWIFDKDSLVTPLGEDIRLQVPYVPPEEYDLKLVISKKAGPDALVVGLVAGGKQFALVIDGGNGTAGGIDLIDGKAWQLTETLFKAKAFPDGKPVTIVCAVRKGKLTVTAEDKTLLDWKTDYKKASLRPAWSVPSKRALMLSAWYSTYHISELWLTPISAQGQKLR